jgi:hypothetical protein
MRVTCERFSDGAAAIPSYRAYSGIAAVPSEDPSHATIADETCRTRPSAAALVDLGCLRLLASSRLGHCGPVATSSLTEAVFSLPEADRRGGVALARDFARRATSTCGYLGCHEDVVQVVSELATNAVCHGSGRPIVRIVGAWDQLLVEVADDAVTWPELRADSWGLQLVALLSESWGVLERAGQKVVWCELTV